MAGLLVEDAQWAFGTDFNDPLAGVDTTVPDGIDTRALASYCLMLGDDALVLAQRLSQWCSRGPDLEVDIALSNIALDLLGQARLLLARAAAADPGIVPALPPGSPVPHEDALAFFRGDMQFRNVRLAEVPDEDFADAVTRIMIFATWRLALFERLVTSRDPVLAAVAAKGVKELAYHRTFAGRWFLTLARGTEESAQRTRRALDRLWPMTAELFQAHPVEVGLAELGVGADPSTVEPEVAGALEQILAVSGLAPPEAVPLAGVGGRTGRDGVHTEALSRLLAEMQCVAREHPMGQW
jgi:ring-1,2-phenylacetyl-CoA epoxidase subunit PaaC